MIVRRESDTLQLITQPDHAHLARRIMERCVPLQQRPRRSAILLAVGKHDNGWAEEDAAPAVDDAGEIYDFVTTPVAVRHRVWPRAVTRLAADPWAAALVAQHAITVYDRFRQDGDWRAFFPDMEAMRDEALRKSGGGLDDLLTDYVFVRLGDLISLTFCTGWSHPQRYDEWTVRRADTTVTVTPDAFGGATVPIDVHAKQLSVQRFANDAALRQAVEHAPTLVLRGSAR